ncbi:hypothetical protein AKUG0406_PHAGE200250 (plasmid) [Apilactobacillus kunkeei]|nr:hypothetical protein AKUG0406_PHAGE200250 [Apilactobacillus kunkeei]CAI2677478.1 hypothetical protein AKUG0403_PHAGE200260 [Apilactobacillus kunkeei]CAI2680713.1 hypothetical protein AKUG0420_PHAGE200260 [Apilactobacillus kunkeei]
MWQITDVLFNFAMIIVCPYLIVKIIAKTIAAITIINQYTHTEYSKANSREVKRVGILMAINFYIYNEFIKKHRGNTR